jgi:hypothetical protein
MMIDLLREDQIAGFYERFCLIDKDFDDKKLQKYGRKYFGEHNYLDTLIGHTNNK